MTMTMQGARQANGGISKEKALRRQQNLLNLVYLHAQKMEDSSFRLPSAIIEQIQTELDFSPPKERTKAKREAEIKKRYRQRGTYRYWKDLLELASPSSADEAKELLLRVYNRLDAGQHWGTLTLSRYALETLHLAVDDLYGTNSLVLEQYKWHLPQKTKKKTKTTKKAKAKPKKQTSVANDAVPF